MRLSLGRIEEIKDKIGWREAALYSRMCEMSGDSDVLDVQRNVLGAIFGVRDRTITYWVKRLEVGGYVRRERKQSGNIYHLLIK